MKQIRQGDVLLEAVDIPVPKGIVAKEKAILAEGELTGHAHVLTASKVYEWEMEGQRYVRVEPNMGQISHEEHDPKPVAVVEPSQTYRVIPQQEWDLKQQWRRVMD